MLMDNQATSTSHSRRHRKQTIAGCVLCSLAAVSLAGCAQLVRPNYTQNIVEIRGGQYSLDKQHTYVNFSIDHLGLSKIIGRFNTIDGSLDFDPENLTELSLQGVIDATSVDVNNTDLEEALQGSDWFSTAQFPQITFESTTVEAGTDGNLAINGDFTMRGITRPITLNARFNGGADNFITRKYTLGFSASTTIKRSDFGIDTWTALIGDDVEVTLHGEFLRN